MQYLLLIHNNEKSWEAMSDEVRAGFMQEFGAFTQDIMAKGHFKGGNQLHPAATAKTVRFRDGKRSLTDGPFAETKEQMGGYYIIEATGMDEALEIAARIPSIRGGDGGVEVRPMVPMRTQPPI